MLTKDEQSMFAKINWTGFDDDVIEWDEYTSATIRDRFGYTYISATRFDEINSLVERHECKGD